MHRVAEGFNEGPFADITLGRGHQDAAVCFGRDVATILEKSRGLRGMSANRDASLAAPSEAGYTAPHPGKQKEIERCFFCGIR